MKNLALTISFPPSSSKAFGEVLGVASQERTFAKIDRPDGETRYSVTYGLDHVEKYRDLWQRVRNWRGVEHQLDEQTVPFAECQDMLDCACEGMCWGAKMWCSGEGRQPSGMENAEPLFPCRFIPIAEANHMGWFQYGTLNRERIFVVDKMLLRQRVDYYLRQAHADVCPLLDEAAISAIVHRLPSRIDPRQDDAWVYKQGWVRGRYQVVGVEKRQGTRPRVQPKEEPIAAQPQPEPLAEAKGMDVETVSSAERTDASGRVIPKVSYSDIGGLDDAISKLREAVELPLKAPHIFEHLGILPHRGVLLYGPPGTGKTLLAKALANECDAHFLLVNGPELISKWHGETEANLRRVFDEARGKAPSVILFDEIDALTPHRDAVTHNFEAVQVSQLLALMDGLVDRGNVVVIGTTNRPDSVDAALRRPGRLELQLEIGLPDKEGREAIFRIHSAKMPLDPDVLFDDIATQTEGLTGAMIAALCREAGLICLREKLLIGTGQMPTLSDEDILAMRVTKAHFYKALDNMRQEKATIPQPSRRRRQKSPEPQQTDKS